MNIEEKAAQYHAQGFNCAQSVLAACGDYTGLDEKTALAASAALGGGVRCGEICGAVTGAAMALGMCFPYNEADDNDAKVNIAVKTKALTNKFKEEFGCIRCLDLKLNGHPCGELIKFCAKSVEEIITSSK
jgi:C_GCAxxG_C_C family probable redox protein